jgi:molybdenum ABC transporter ATP-binding protein
MATTLNRADPATVENTSQRTGLQVRVRRTLTSEDGGFQLDVDFELQNGITILFGPSGAGKTTLLDCIAGVTDPEKGRIVVGARVLIDSENGINLSPTKRNIGYIFQDLALFPHMTVEANVAYGLRELKADDRKQRVAGALEGLGISDLRARRPAELSGGERQRVALARALVTQPSVLLLDEPLAALDMPVRMKIAEDLRRSIQALPIPVLYVTHSRDEVFMLGERMLILERGKIIAEGTPHQVMSAPRSQTVAQLAGFENVFDAEVISIHEERGTMTCRVTAPNSGRARLPAVPTNHEEVNGTTEVVPSRDYESAVASAQIELETPLVRAEVGTKLRVGISAGDVLLGTAAPVGLSARNILPGKLLSLWQRDMIVVARVDCGVEMSVHLTLAARDSLQLTPGRQVWLIVKTHSCHLLA